MGLFAPVAADVPTVPVGTAGTVSGTGIAVFEATQINDRNGALLVLPLPAGAARAGDLPGRRDGGDLHQRPRRTERGDQAGFGCRDVLVDRCRFIRPQDNTADLNERAAAGDLIAWTVGKVLIATGSPFGPVLREDRSYQIAQANNALVFPRLGLGVVVAKATRISARMIAAAAGAVARMSEATTPGASLLPPMTDLRAVSAAVAIADATTAAEAGLAQVELHDPIQQVHDAMWRPDYPQVVLSSATPTDSFQPALCSATFIRLRRQSLSLGGGAAMLIACRKESNPAGSASASREITVSGAAPPRIRLIGTSHFFPLRVRGRTGTVRMLSGTCRGVSWT